MPIENKNHEMLYHFLDLQIIMPAKNKNGPPKGSTGPRDGRGQGRGNHSGSKTGAGKQTGGRKGSC